LAKETYHFKEPTNRSHPHPQAPSTATRSSNAPVSEPGRGDYLYEPHCITSRSHPMCLCRSWESLVESDIPGCDQWAVARKRRIHTHTHTHTHTLGNPLWKATYPNVISRRSRASAVYTHTHTHTHIHTHTRTLGNPLWKAAYLNVIRRRSRASSVYAHTHTHTYTHTHLQ